ncbi:MAG: tetratricopeptide repeat protein, partial [Myxococcales bacterium]|nr:tetratricopeptide repeat protein [Myxococcales bacterium]
AFVGEVDPRSDQWSFCVTTLEALTGRRPFEAHRFSELLTAIREATPRPPSRRAGVPPRVWTILARGLAKDADDRWADMETLIAALEDTVDGRRRRLAATGASLFLSLLTGSLAAARSSEQPQCRVDAEALAGVWDPPRREALRAGFSAAGPALGERPLAHAEASLDHWRDAWLAGQRDACTATRVDGLASEARLDARTACYARKRSELRAIVDLLSSGEPEPIARSAEVLAALPSLDDCADEQLVETRFPVPEARADAIDDAYARILELRTLARIGRIDDADRALEVLRSELPSLDYRPLTIEVQALAGEQAAWHLDYEPAVEQTLAAVRTAEALRLDDLVARERVRLAATMAGFWGQPERERWLVEDAAAALARLEREAGPLAVDLDDARGRLAGRAGDFDGALAHFGRALAAAEALGDVQKLTMSRAALARTHAALGDFDRAATELDAAAATIREQLGPSAPSLAELEVDRALLAMQRGDFDGAAAPLERATAIFARAYGPGSAAAARAELAAGRLALLQGDLDGAEQAFTRAAGPGVSPYHLPDAQEALGVIAFYRGDYRGSIAAYQRALALRRRQVGDDHPELAILHSNLGESFAALQEYDEALAAFDRSLTLLERSLPADHPDLALPLKGRGQVRLALGSPALAAVDLERALSLHTQHPGEPLERADVEFSLALALAALGEDPRADELARSAQAHFLELQQDERADEIARWLGAR